MDNSFSKLDLVNYLSYVRDVFGPELYDNIQIPKFEESKHQKDIEKEQSPIKPKPINKKEDSKETTRIKESTVNPNWKEAKSLEELKEYIKDCSECKLGLTRNKFVFGSGDNNADLMVIGEAPGADEDAQGLPFVGRAGKLLTKILESVGFAREEVYIANIIKSRPPGNRRPEADEIKKCEPYLKKQIELINPKFILSLGLTSIDTLLKTKHKMMDIRGRILEYEGRKLICTYHPAALLRNPKLKRATWEDMKELRRLYDEARKNG